MPGNSTPKDPREPLRLLARDIIERRHVFVIDDLIDASAYLLSAAPRFHVVFAQSSYLTSSPPPSRLYIPYLSFSRDTDSVQRYSDPTSIDSLAVAWQHQPDWMCYHRDHVSLLLEISTPPSDEARKLFHLFTDTCRLFYVTSEAFNNSLRSYAHKVSKRFFGTTTPGYDFTALSDYVYTTFHISASVVVPSRDSFLNSQTYHPGALEDGLLTHADLRSQILLSLKRKQRYSGRVSYNDMPWYYVIFPLLDPRFLPTPPRAVFIVASPGKRLTLSSLTAITELLNDFAIHRYVVDQLGFVHSLQSSLIRIPSTTDKSLTSRTHLTDAIRAFAMECVTGIVQNSSALSAVLRLYNAADDSLVPCAVKATEHGLYDAGSPDRIPIVDWQESVNAFCYTRCGPGEYVYLPDCAIIPSLYAERGLKTVKRARQKAASEICIPLHHRGLRIGTINIESASLGAFDADIMFFQNVAAAFADFYWLLTASSDSEWLSRLSFRHIAYHRLDAFLRKLPTDIQDQFRTLVDRAEATASMFPPTPTHVSLASVVQRLVALAADLQQSPEPATVVSADGNQALFVSAAFADSLQVIVGSLLENSATYARLPQDTVSISIVSLDTLDPDHVGASELRIRYSSSGQVDRQFVDRLFIAPLSGGEPRTLHLGLFLVGVHTRLLGGVVELCTPAVSFSDALVPLDVAVRIPLVQE